MLNNFKDDLFKADSISITFDFQKNQERQETVTQEHPTDPDLCPVRSAASIIMFIVCMPGMSANTSINSFRDNSGGKNLISSVAVVFTLQEAAASMCKGVLGFSPANIGCDSIRSACAMALYLAEISVATIMPIGR